MKPTREDLDYLVKFSRFEFRILSRRNLLNIGWRQKIKRSRNYGKQEVFLMTRLFARTFPIKYLSYCEKREYNSRFFFRSKRFDSFGRKLSKCSIKNNIRKAVPVVWLFRVFTRYLFTLSCALNLLRLIHEKVEGALQNKWTPRFRF